MALDLVADTQSIEFPKREPGPGGESDLEEVSAAEITIRH